MGTMVEQIAIDCRQTLRGLRRSPGLTSVVVATLVIGIGANATMLGILERLLLRAPSHVEQPSRVRRLLFAAGDATSAIALSNFPIYTALGREVPAFTGVAAYAPLKLALGSGVDAYPIRAQLVTPNLFSVLGVRAELGRFFVSEEGEGTRGAAVAILGYSFWRGKFAADSGVLGRAVSIGDVTYLVVGVAPEGFTGVDLEPIDLFLPVSAASDQGGPQGWTESYGSTWLRIIARLRDNATDEVAVAQATATVRATNERSGLPQVILANSVLLAPLSAARGTERQLEVKVSIALGVVSLAVLLSACANVAFILLAKGVERRREVAVRLALGANRARLAGQMMVEALALSVAGGLGALAVLHWSGGFLRAILLPDVAWNSSAVDARAIVATMSLVVVTTVVTGLAGAVRFSRSDVVTSLRHGDRGISQPRSVVRRGLLVAQASFAMLAVASAALFVESLRNVQAIETGIDLRRVVVARVEVSGLTSGESNALYELVAQKVAGLPRVEHSALIMRSVPLVHAYGIAVRVPGLETPPRIAGSGPYYSATTPEFLATLGTKLISGRNLSMGDLRFASRVALINETMSKRRWAGANPIGSCLLMGSDSTCTEVIGVVQDVIKFRLFGEPEPQMAYLPLTHPFVKAKPVEALLVRTSGRASETVPQLRRSIAALLPTQSRLTVESYEETVEPQVRPWRLGATVLTYFGFAALLICTIGLYGLMNYLVMQRRHEFGVRRALGAGTWGIASIVLHEGLLVVGIGVLAGGLVAVGASRFISSLLYGVSPVDGGVMALSATTLVAATALAGLWPTVRALRVQPAEAMRAE